MTDADVTFTFDESKYAGMPRALAAATRKLDLNTQKKANLEARKEKARAKLDKVLEAIDAKLPALNQNIAVATVQIAAFHTNEAAVQAELDRLNGVVKDESDETDEGAQESVADMLFGETDDENE